MSGFRARRLRRAELALADSEDYYDRWAWGMKPSDLDWYRRKIEKRRKRVERAVAAVPEGKPEQ